MSDYRPKKGDFIWEHGAMKMLGYVFACGPLTYDVIWHGGGTSRYRHGERNVHPVADDDPNIHPRYDREHLLKEAAAARQERAAGAGIKRGQIWP